MLSLIPHNLNLLSINSSLYTVVSNVSIHQYLPN